MSYKLRGGGDSPLQLQSDFLTRFRRAYALLTGQDSDSRHSPEFNMLDTAQAVVQLADLTQAPYRSKGRKFVSLLTPLPVSVGNFHYALLLVPMASRKLVVVDEISVEPQDGVSLDIGLISVPSVAALTVQEKTIQAVEEGRVGSAVGSLPNTIDGIKNYSGNAAAALTFFAMAGTFASSSGTGIPPKLYKLTDLDIVLTPGVALIVQSTVATLSFVGYIRGRYYETPVSGPSFP